MEKKNPGKKSKRVYVIKNGKQVLSWHEFGKIQGIILNNTHNFEELKKHRDSLFEKELSKVEHQWNLSKVKPKANDYLFARLEWLKQEIPILTRWDQNSDLAAKTQLLQYRKGIEVEIERIEMVSKNEKLYSTFNQLYDDALHFGLIVYPEKSEDPRRRINYDTRLIGAEFDFNSFISVNFKVELNRWNYYQFLTRENLIELVKNKQNAKSTKLKIFEAEKKKWSIVEVQPGLVNFQMFENIFTVSDWEKYVDILCNCTPPLLKKENEKYQFIGNKKTQKGCVAQWFKFLKLKGIVKATVNRDELAKVLGNEINNFKISGATIDNNSKTYERTFQDQLQKKDF